MNDKDRIYLRQNVAWMDADMDTPITLYFKAVENEDAILLESAEVDGRWGRYSLLCCNMGLIAYCMKGRLRLDIRDRRFEPLKTYEGMPFIEGIRTLLEKIEYVDCPTELPPITRALYGYFGFGMAAIFNPYLANAMPEADLQAALAIPNTTFVFDHLYNRLYQLSLDEPRSILNLAILPSEKIDIGNIKSTPDEKGYKQFVINIREQLRQGEAIQVVPSVRFCADFEGDPFQLYRRMRNFNASPYMFFMRFPKITLFGASPEVMVRCTQNRLELSPIAGTRRRGKTEQEDAKLAQELLSDPKERAEHVMLVDLGRNDLGRLAKPGSVQVDRLMQIQKFSHVMHITSDVSADLAPVTSDGRKADALDVLAATFPAGTVSGAPKIRALEIIAEMEGMDRGPYAGCIGWLGLDKDTVNLDMGITIRSMWVKDGKLCWQAGGGIVHDSDPDLEWKEVNNKSAIMRLALNLEDSSHVSANR